MDLSPEELREMMSRPGSKRFRLVDVREEDEFAICRIERAELIPLAQLAEQAPLKLPDKSTPVVVCCHHGLRSWHATGVLRKLGYEEVYNLAGGLEAWADRVDPAMARY
jgi:rhodanese-related sulfurtransferase